MGQAKTQMFQSTNSRLTFPNGMAKFSSNMSTLGNVGSYIISHTDNIGVIYIL